MSQFEFKRLKRLFGEEKKDLTAKFAKTAEDKVNNCRNEVVTTIRKIEEIDRELKEEKQRTAAKIKDLEESLSLAKREEEKLNEEIQKSKDCLQKSKDSACHDIVRVLETELECGICKEMYIDAKILTSCTHAFCSSRITMWGNQELTCPTCRTPFTYNDVKPFPMGGLLDKIEDNLPKETQRRRTELRQERK